MKYIKFIGLVATIFTVLVLLSGTAMAAFSGDGAGTAADPYQITDSSQLSEIRNELSASYILANDIIITNSKWEAIGNSSKPFTGTFNGNGKTITLENSSGILLNQSATAMFFNTNGSGLFGNVKSAAFENVTLVVKSNLTTNFTYTGILVGYSDGTSSSKSSFENCFILKDESGGTEISLYYGEKGYIGGLIGYANNTTVENSGSDFNLTSDKTSAGSNVGGLLGYIENSTVSNCSASCTVTGSYSYSGGLIGFSSNCTIEKSYATGSVTASSLAGGFIGSARNGSVNECYAEGAVKTTSFGSVGGFAGDTAGGTIKNCYAIGDVTLSGYSYAGGFVGYLGNLSSTKIEDCYSAGKVTGTSYAGGFLGNVFNRNLADCFYDTDISGKTDNTGNGTPKSTANMMKNETFSNWDISNEEFGQTIWYIYEDENYPQLTAFHKPETISAATRGDLIHIGSDEIRKDYNGEWKSWTMDADYILDGNINMNGVSFTPIGTDSNPFTGTFTGADGFEFAISNLEIDASIDNNVGLFGYTDNAVISNIHLENVSVSGNRNVGGLIGRANGVTEITQSSVTGTLSAAANHAGGLVGFFVDGEIIQCYTDVDVAADSEAGGFVGAMKNGLISESYATGPVTADTEVAGGFVGEFDGAELTIENSFALNEYVDTPLHAGQVIGLVADDTGLTIDSVSFRKDLENSLGTFDGAELGDGIEDDAVWNTFDTSISPWELWSAADWELSANELFLLPTLIDMTDSVADASHLMPAPVIEAPKTGGSGGKGTGSATIVSSANSTNSSDSSSSNSSSNGTQTGTETPATNAPQNNAEGFGTDIEEEGSAGSSNTRLIGILILGLIVVVLAVGVFLKNRK